MGLEQLHLEGIDKVQFSIELIQANQPIDDYYLAFSGGKDSQSLYRLAQLAGVRFKAYYCQNPLDPPELRNFIKSNYPDVIFEKAPMPFWKAFELHGYPRRNSRWCCEYIKEWAGSGRTVLLGLRSQESRGRRKRCFINYNDKGRTRFDKGKTKNVICPILLWTSNDIWTFLKREQVDYCSLYDEGASGKYKGDGYFKRLGCVLCPSAGVHRIYEKERWPMIAEAWRRAGAKFWAKHENPQSRWDNPDDMFNWWLTDNPAPPRKELIKVK